MVWRGRRRRVEGESVERKHLKWKEETGDEWEPFAALWVQNRSEEVAVEVWILNRSKAKRGGQWGWGGTGSVLRLCHQGEKSRLCNLSELAASKRFIYSWVTWSAPSLTNLLVPWAMTHDAKLTFAQMMRTSLSITYLAGSTLPNTQAETAQSVLCDVLKGRGWGQHFSLATDKPPTKLWCSSGTRSLLHTLE